MAVGAHYLLGGDALARDVFSRMVAGSWIVVQIAPLATMFAFMVGITLGLPAGYFGGRLDTFLSFLANLILAFPVILLFYLLVTPEIVQTGIPNYMAAVFFIFPIIFITVLLNSRYKVLPHIRTPLLAVVLVIAFWVYFSTISDVTRNPKTLVDFFPSWLDLFNIPGGVLVVFIAVEGVFRRRYAADADQGEGAFHLPPPSQTFCASIRDRPSAMAVKTGLRNSPSASGSVPLSSAATSNMWRCPITSPVVQPLNWVTVAKSASVRSAVTAARARASARKSSACCMGPPCGSDGRLFRFSERRKQRNRALRASHGPGRAWRLAGPA